MNQSSLVISSYSDDSKPEIRDTFILLLYSFTSIVAMFGNLFVCETIWRKKRLGSTTYKLIFNMAVSDILGGFVIPGQWLLCSTLVLDSGKFGQAMCGLFKSLQILSYYVSSLTMTAIAYDRYRLVCRPMSGRINVHFILALIWALGLIFISGNFFTLRVSEYFSPTKGLINCRVVFQSNMGLVFRRVRSLSLMVTQYIVPLGLTAVFYALVMRAIYSREQIAGAQSDTKRQAFDEKKRRTIKMLMVVTVLFGLSYLPTHVMHFLMFFTKVIPQRKNTCHSTTFYMLCYWLGISTCAYNPFIYCYFNEEFKREASRYWRLVMMPCATGPTVTHSHCDRDSSEDHSGIGASTTTSTSKAVQVEPESSKNTECVTSI